MQDPPVTRRLAAILAADVAGYSRLVAADEEATLRTLGAYRTTIADLAAEHGGRIFGTAGDSVMIEFASAVQAARSAVAIQRALKRYNDDLPSERRLEFRIGINLGDVVAERGDLLGDGVNVAARVQEIAPPAGICLTGAMAEQASTTSASWRSASGC
ncbi:adenylate/guanylate cyclase domain-containing protein [Arvimicrobium flavum]|uniref:adenylate/guanylate cyclase domain-containing protein n=1 Tax=Arvimicrobium flavum TaxID=3393320 RepID=UPI00237B813B|nr:adenylate/guanylate cyclase domain-containing protein [Mesorhizobium shangrilense]